MADRGYFARAYFRALDEAGGHFIVRAGSGINPLIVQARGPNGRTLAAFTNRHLKDVTSRLSRFEYLDMKVRFGPWTCRLVVHPNLVAGRAPRYVVTNLDPEVFTPQHVSDAYRLRWQVELLFKEWKSYANLRAFDTSNPHIAEGLIWAALCVATLKRYCAHMTQKLLKVPISTQTVAKCIHRLLSEVLWALLHQPPTVSRRVQRMLTYLHDNARRARPARDQRTGRLKLGLEHVYAAA